MWCYDGRERRALVPAVALNDALDALVLLDQLQRSHRAHTYSSHSPSKQSYYLPLLFTITKTLVLVLLL
jgi:hypothetical protein